MSLPKQDDGEYEDNVTPADPLLLLPAISHEKLAKSPSCASRFSGIFYTLLASFLFTASTFVIKELGVDLLDALLSRFLIQTMLTLGFTLYKKYTLLGGTAQEIILQLLCCGTGAAGLFLFFLAVRYVELSDVVTLCYTRVVWTVLASLLVYHERPSIGTLLALPLTLVGVIFVTQPNFLFSSKVSTMGHVMGHLRFLGFAMAFACALTSTVNVLLFKQLISSSKTVKPSVLNLQFCVAVLIFLILNQFYKVFFVQATVSFSYVLTWRYGLSSLVFLINILASVLVQKAIKREDPAVFSLLGSSDIIFSLILQNIFTSTRSNLFALLGSALVISSVLLIGISRIFNERRVKDKTKLSEVMKNGEC